MAELWGLACMLLYLIALAPMKFRHLDWCHPVVTNPSAYGLPVYHIRIYPRKQGGMNRTRIICVGRIHVVEGFVLWLSAELSFCFSSWRKSTLGVVGQEGLWGEFGLPNNRIFSLMLVIEHSLQFASFAICDVVRLFLLVIMCTIIWRCRGFRFRAVS